MACQDYTGAVHWVIVDDGADPQPITFNRAGWTLQVIRPEPFWQPGQNTQARNLLAGLDAMPDNAAVVIIEDDDWYAPDWLITVDQALSAAELIGEPRSRYYNLRTRRGRQLTNSSHASLCSTAVRGRAIQALADQCRTAPKFIDIQLWKRHRSKCLIDGQRVVGIKGLPGRDGIGIGHRDSFHGEDDPSLTLLRRWVGDDIDHYQPFTNRS